MNFQIDTARGKVFLLDSEFSIKESSHGFGSWIHRTLLQICSHIYIHIYTPEHQSKIKLGKHGDIPRGLAKHLLASQLLISSTDGDKINRNPQPIRIRPILIILFTIIYSILYTRKERGKKRQTLDRAISSGTAAARNRKNRRRQCKGRRDETVARRVLPTLSPPTSRCQRSSQPAARGRNSQNRTAHVIHKRNHSFFFLSFERTSI